MQTLRRLRLLDQHVDLTATCLTCGTDHWIIPDPNNVFYTSARDAYVTCGVQTCLMPEECHYCRYIMFNRRRDEAVLAFGENGYNSTMMAIPNMPGPGVDPGFDYRAKSATA